MSTTTYSLITPVAALLAALTCAPTAIAHPANPERIAVQPGSGLRLSADELNYRTGKMELRGRVTIGLGKLGLQAARLVVELDPEGRPRRLLANGGIELHAGDASGRAAQASLEVAQGALELSGKVRVKLRSTNLELEGERVELDLAGGGLRVRRARAVLSLPAPEVGGHHARR